MAFKLLDIEAEYLRAGAARDNRMAWAQILEDGFLEVNDKVTVVIPMTRIYLIALDSTCGVERDLGVVTRALDAHAGPLDDNGDTLWDVTEVLLGGPTAELELGVWESGNDGSVAQQAGQPLRRLLDAHRSVPRIRAAVAGWSRTAISCLCPKSKETRAQATASTTRHHGSADAWVS